MINDNGTSDNSSKNKIIKEKVHRQGREGSCYHRLINLIKHSDIVEENGTSANDNVFLFPPLFFQTSILQKSTKYAAKYETFSS